jgi:DHA3 family macrolide efflux protein-like MFS transporter
VVKNKPDNISMKTQPILNSWQTFILVWTGQTASLIGSSMTNFALEIWAWELTGKATALALVMFFIQAARVLVSPFAGSLVDRGNRKLLMMVGDSISVLSTIIILTLYLTGSLQIWHLYIMGAISGVFGEIQELAYSASISLMVPAKYYDRASSLGFLAGYGADIFAPALAGMVYGIIGLVGIWCIDITTFAIAILTVLWVAIPQPIAPKNTSETPQHFFQDFLFGFQYIGKNAGLLILLISTSLFWFAHDLGAAIYAPMILAKTGNNAEVLASVYTAAGVGGVLGALIISRWGVTKKRIYGVLLGMMGAGLSKTIFGLGSSLFVWVPAQFFSSLNFPLMGSATDAIWLHQVKPEVQGRVFATRSVMMVIMSLFAYAIAGPLADQIFEPAMLKTGILAPILGGIFGTGKGAGMAVLYVISSLILLGIGSAGYFSKALRNVEETPHQ